MKDEALLAERAVLGSVLMDQRAILLLSATITPEDFASPKHRAVWRAMLALHERGDAIDLLTVQNALPPADFEAMGGRQGFTALLDEATTPTNVETYARQLLDAAMKRQLLIVAAEIREAATSSASGEIVADLAQQALGRVVTRRLGHQTVQLHQAVRELAKATFERVETGKTEATLPTGFSALDELTAGLHPGSLVVVGGRPSMGKTAFAMALTVNVGRRGPVFLFSSEMRRDEIALRYLAGETGIDMQRIRQARVTDPELEQLGRAAGSAEALRVVLDDTSGASVHYVRNRCRLLAIDERPAAVVIDYLQLLTFPGVDDPRIEVTRISSALKALARELECPVIALSQLNRGLESRADKRPMLADLRESGSIEQDADDVWFLFREWVYDRRADPAKADLIVAKQRNGALGTVRLRFDRGVFSDPDAGELPLAPPSRARTPAEALAGLVERTLRRGGAMPVDDLADALQREHGWRGSTRELWAVLELEGWARGDGYAGLG